MLITSLFICFLAYVVRFNVKITDSFVKLVSVQWFFVLLAYWISEGFFTVLTADFYIQFIKFFLSVLLSYCVFYFFIIKIKTKKIKPFIDSNVLYTVSMLLSIFSIICFVYYFKIYGDFYRFRQAFLVDNISLYIGWSFPLAAASYFYAKKNNDNRKKMLFLLVMIVLALVSLSKIFLILALLFGSSIFENDNNISAKKILIIVFLGFSSFALMHILMKKVAGLDQYPLIIALGYTILGYFLGGIAAFQMIVTNSFSTGLYYPSVLDLLRNTPVHFLSSTDAGWVKTGNWYGNVYSGFAPWYEMNKVYGLAIYGVIIGLIGAIIYGKAKNNMAFQFMKGFLFYSILFIVFYDTFVLSAKLWFAFFIAAYVLSMTKGKLNY